VLRHDLKSWEGHKKRMTEERRDNQKRHGTEDLRGRRILEVEKTKSRKMGSRWKPTCTLDPSRVPRLRTSSKDPGPLFGHFQKRAIRSAARGSKSLQLLKCGPDQSQLEGGGEPPDNYPIWGEVSEEVPKRSGGKARAQLWKRINVSVSKKKGGPNTYILVSTVLKHRPGKARKTARRGPSKSIRV